MQHNNRAFKLITLMVENYFYELDGLFKALTTCSSNNDIAALGNSTKRST